MKNGSLAQDMLYKRAGNMISETPARVRGWRVHKEAKTDERGIKTGSIPEKSGRKI